MRNKYYTCSSLVSTLLPEPSEGKVRALFSRKNPPSKVRTAKDRLKTAGSNVINQRGSTPGLNEVEEGIIL
jgi:hypothetical protein